MKAALPGAYRLSAIWPVPHGRCAGVDVPVPLSRSVTGFGRNGAEIAAVVGEVRRLRTAYPDPSIGVVTPLATQPGTGAVE